MWRRLASSPSGRRTSTVASPSSPRPCSPPPRASAAARSSCRSSRCSESSPSTRQAAAPRPEPAPPSHASSHASSRTRLPLRLSRPLTAARRPPPGAQAIPLSIATVFGASTYSALGNYIWQKHPVVKHRHQIAYDVVLVLLPSTLLGSTAGVFLNKVCAPNGGSCCICAACACALHVHTACALHVHTARRLHVHVYCMCTLHVRCLCAACAHCTCAACALHVHTARALHALCMSTTRCAPTG